MPFAIEIETIHVTEVIRGEDILLPLLIIKSAGIEITPLEAVERSMRRGIRRQIPAEVRGALKQMRS